MKLIFILTLVLMTGCAGFLRSGMHVQLKQSDTLQSLSREFKVSESILKDANPHKTFRPGEWVFVPQNKGILASRINRKIASPAKIDESFYQDIYNDSGDYTWPVPSHKSVSSNFGPRWGRHHDGIDIPARKGTHIVSVSDGVVVYAGAGLGGYGNLTVISHRNGLFSVYAHSDKLYTTKGQKVYKGQVIATVGSTGRSTGDHLHFEIRKNSNPVDPKKVFARNK